MVLEVHRGNEFLVLENYLCAPALQLKFLDSRIQKSRRFQQGAGNGFNLVAVFKYPQQDHRRRRGEAVVVRAGEVAVKEESGTPSLGLEVVETNLANSRV